MELHPEISEFLIVEDEYLFKKYRGHEVYLEFYRGILEEHIEPSINILNGKLQGYPLRLEYEENPCLRLIKISEFYKNKVNI